MKTRLKVVAWLCIFSTLLMGCYTSIIVEPTGDGKNLLRSHRIGYLVSKDSVKYVYDKPPIIVNDTIVGEFTSVPLAHVSYASIEDMPLPDSIAYVVTTDGRRYDFDSRARVLNGYIVGELVFDPADTSRSRLVAIPLSEVAFASDASDTISWLVWGGLAAAAGIMLAVAVYIWFYP
jgi:hypothetical protein